MRLAYFTPVKPAASGVADVVEELLPALSKFFDIDIFVTDKKAVASNSVANDFPLHDLADFEEESLREQFHEKIFQVGNNKEWHDAIIQVFLKYGGILELHDIAMHHYLAGVTLDCGDTEGYKRAMLYCHGEEGKRRAEKFLSGQSGAPWEEDSLNFPVINYLLEKAHAVIVHSVFAKELVKGNDFDIPVFNIPLPTKCCNFDSEIKKQMRDKLHIPQQQYTIGSFGYATEAKRVRQICQALALMKNSNIHYYIVGPIQESFKEDIERIAESGGCKKQVHVIGFVEEEIFDQYIQSMDFCFNLRNPTQGESSASILRVLKYQVPAAVTDIGSLHEIPDNVVEKVLLADDEVSQIYNLISKYISLNDDELEVIRLNEKQYCFEQHDVEKVARQYYNFIMEFYHTGFRENDYITGFLDILSKFRLTNDKYINHLIREKLW